MKILMLLIAVFAFVSCMDSNKTPEQALRNFIKKVTNNELSQDDYSAITTGKMLQGILDMDSEEFEAYKRSTSISGVKTEILSKNCSEVKCSLTYIVKYMSKTTDGSKFKTEVRKIAQLEKIEENWMLSDVENVKTYHESQDPITPLED